VNSDNPYQPPTTTVEVVKNNSDDVWAFVEPQKVSIGRGIVWLGEGFRFFGRNAGIWIAITIIYLIILMLSSFVPFATNILQPMLAGGLMLGVHDQDNGEPLQVQHLFEGFNKYAGPLATLGALILGLMILYFIVVMVFVLIGVGVTAATEQYGDISVVIIITMLVIGAPIMIAVTFIFMSVSWFGPPLVALHGLSVGEAFKMSLLGLKRNILPILVFTFFMMILFILSVFTLYIGLLVVIPVLMAASYASWKDVFTRANEQLV
jgi:uncharacterized membrane protein